MINIKKLTAASIIGILMTGTVKVLPGISVGSDGDTTSTATGAISPAHYEQEMAPATTVRLDRVVTVNVDAIAATTISIKPQKLDVLFLADNTGSMGSAISNVQANAQSLLQTLSESYDDIQVGVARYYGDPTEYGEPGASITVNVPTGETVPYSYSLEYKGESSCPSYYDDVDTCYEYDVTYDRGGDVSTWTSYFTSYDYYGDSYTYTWDGMLYEQVTKTPATAAYELQKAINSGSIDDAETAIDDWSASGGGDWPEANFFALHQAASSGAAIDGYATGYDTNWRSDAKKIIVWFGDAKSHTNTVEQAETIEALAAKDISVIAINASSSSYSLTNGIDSHSQASGIASATGGQFASVYSSDVATTMESLIDYVAVETTTTTAGTIDLDFASQGNTDGLTITYTCTDTQGCDDVLDGQSRTFRMDVTGVPGTYEFNTVVTDVGGAIASNIVIIPNHPD